MDGGGRNDYWYSKLYYINKLLENVDDTVNLDDETSLAFVKTNEDLTEMYGALKMISVTSFDKKIKDLEGTNNNKKLRVAIQLLGFFMILNNGSNVINEETMEKMKNRYGILLELKKVFTKHFADILKPSNISNSYQSYVEKRKSMSGQGKSLSIASKLTNAKEKNFMTFFPRCIGESMAILNNNRETMMGLMATKAPTGLHLQEEIIRFVSELYSVDGVEATVATVAAATVKKPSKKAASVKQPSKKAASVKQPSKKAASVKRPSKKAASVKRPSKKAASVKRPSKKAASVKRPSKKAASVKRPEEQGEQQTATEEPPTPIAPLTAHTLTQYSMELESEIKKFNSNSLSSNDKKFIRGIEIISKSIRDMDIQYPNWHKETNFVHRYNNIFYSNAQNIRRNHIL